MTPVSILVILFLNASNNFWLFQLTLTSLGLIIYLIFNCLQVFFVLNIIE